MPDATAKMSADVYKQLKEHCKANGLVIKNVMDEAILSYIKGNNKGTAKLANDIEELKKQVAELQKAVFKE